MVFVQDGEGGKFDTLAAGQSIGSGLALLSIATLAAEIVLLYFPPKRRAYRSAKYEAMRYSEYSDDFVSNRRARAQDISGEFHD